LWKNTHLEEMTKREEKNESEVPVKKSGYRGEKWAEKNWWLLQVWKPTAMPQK
jgi:hypothetical protein